MSSIEGADRRCDEWVLGGRTVRSPKVRAPESSVRHTSSRFRERSQLRRAPTERPRCLCEEPGYFKSGVSGIIAHLENGIVLSKVERCDACRRYPSDVEARLALLRRGFRAKYSNSVELFIYCRKCGNTGGPDPEGFRLFATAPEPAVAQRRGSVIVECGTCGNRQILPAKPREQRVQ